MSSIVARALAPARQLADTARTAAKDKLRGSYQRLGVRKAKLDWLLWNTQGEHARLLREAHAVPRTRPEHRVLIIPTDPVLLTSSRGDEAMYTSALSAIERQLPGAEVCVFAIDDRADGAARSLGMVPVRVKSLHLLNECLEHTLRLRPRHVMLLGADGMDGAHDPNFSFSLLANADLAARAGVPATVTGFSVSLDADVRLAPYFAGAHSNLRIFVRDPVSLARFQASCPERAELVADLAFTLEPTRTHARARALESFIAERHGAGDRVLGLNIHPLLYGALGAEELREHAQRFVRELLPIIQRDQPSSVVLIAHDFRGSSADGVCHRLIAPWLREQLGARFFDLDEVLPASDIKGVVANLDGVITGRMHLMIAALGGGVPVLGLNYRDKMEGLAQLFELEQGVVSNADFLAVAPLLEQAAAFSRNLSKHRETVRKNVSGVVQLAQKNFEGLNAGNESRSEVSRHVE